MPRIHEALLKEAGVDDLKNHGHIWPNAGVPVAENEIATMYADGTEFTEGSACDHI
jgi:hypothetical protein